MTREVVSKLGHVGQSPKAVVVAPCEPAVQSRISRRSVLRVAFWTSILATLGGIGATIVNALYPRGVTGFGGPVAVKARDVPRVGDPPKQNVDGHFLLVNLAADEGKISNDDATSSGGLLALWWKCPHLGCTVPWKSDFVAKDDPLARRGWFNCNCHGSTYTKAGVRVSGPAPRSMDTMAITVDASGDIVVDTGARNAGALDNPRRAVPWQAG
jgi:cytochrome b6-f complex iron-sulfur subunit